MATDVEFPPHRMEEDSSEDDSEVVPKGVNNYWLEDGDNNAVSIADVPIDSKTGEAQSTEQDIYLRGVADSGSQPVFVKAEAWKIHLTKDDKPTILVLCKGNYWIQLMKPRKSYEETVRGIFVVAQFLNYALNHPDTQERNVWGHLNDVFRSSEDKPSRNDLASHIDIIQHYVAKKTTLQNSSVLQTILSSLSKRKVSSDSIQQAGKRSFESDDDVHFVDAPINDQKRIKTEDHKELDDSTGFFDEDNFDEEMDFDVEVGDLSETVCAICDNGGDVLCCDGPCMRSFHLNKEADGARDANCSSLGFTKTEVDTMDKYFCPNCKYKKHQCYACGELGCSDESLGTAQEVFICDVAICGKFYHPDCVAKLLFRENESQAEALAQGIRDSQGFSCPIHSCWKCSKVEVKADEALQFGICRRCPRAWHRQCLPSSILFEATDDEPQRAWEDLLPDRILIYCKRHRIIPKLGTPSRDHVKFPQLPEKLTVKQTVKARPDAQATRTKPITQKSVPRSLKSKKDSDQLSSHDKQQERSTPSHLKQHKPKAIGQKSGRDTSSTGQKNGKEISAIGQKSGREILAKDSSLRPSLKVEPQIKKKIKLSMYASGKASLVGDTEIRSMVDGIIKKSRESVTLESIIQKHEVPLCYRRFSKSPDKKYSLTKIESIVRAMRRSLEILDKGGSIEEAKTKCEVNFVKFIDGCKNELKVYLSPFLHGMRYTSFGRHFTKVNKLEEVVERLHWYVQDGDMVVDYCCGSNDFSILMRDKIARSGKKCQFKNFDIIQPKNDFNFEKRDWLKVKENELPTGSRLIMGLNPPFGVKGQLANSFINQALKFKPKLVVLIVPKETERLDRKPEKYNLIWEDPELLKGESFYLPGSVDVNENPLSQWNAVAPPLYLWSRPDWTQRHREIALQLGHISGDSLSDPSPRFAGNQWMPQPEVQIPLPPIVDAAFERQKSDPQTGGVAEFRSKLEATTLEDATFKDEAPFTGEVKDHLKDFISEPFNQCGSSLGLGIDAHIDGLPEKHVENNSLSFDTLCTSAKEDENVGNLGGRESQHWQKDKLKDLSKKAIEGYEHGNQVKKSPERHGRDSQRKNSPARHRRESQRNKSLERHGDYNERKNSPERHGHDSQRKKSPGRNSQKRRSLERYGHDSQRNKSPEGHGHKIERKSPDRQGHEYRRKRSRSPERHVYDNLRKKSPDRYGLSSSMEMETSRYLHSSRDDPHTTRDRVSDKDGSYDDAFRYLNERDRQGNDYRSSDYDRTGSSSIWKQNHNWRSEVEEERWSRDTFENYGSKSKVREADEQFEKVDEAGLERSYLNRDYHDNLNFQGTEGSHKKVDFYDSEVHFKQEGLDSQGTGLHLKREFYHQDPVFQGNVNPFKTELEATYRDRGHFDIQGMEGGSWRKDYSDSDVLRLRDFNGVGNEGGYREREYYKSSMLGSQSGDFLGLQKASYDEERHKQHEPYLPQEPITNPIFGARSLYERQSVTAHEMDLMRRNRFLVGLDDGLMQPPPDRLQASQIPDWHRQQSSSFGNSVLANSSIHSRVEPFLQQRQHPIDSLRQPIHYSAEPVRQPPHHLYDGRQGPPSITGYSSYPAHGIYPGPSHGRSSQHHAGWIDE